MATTFRNIALLGVRILNKTFDLLIDCRRLLATLALTF